MKVRIAKKHAKAFMAGAREYPVTTYWFPTLNGQGVYKAEYRFPFKVLREVDRLAFRRGWDGCHWDAPTLLGVIEDGELRPLVGGWGTEKLTIAARVFEKEGLL